ncbi:leucine-rich repeat domain-containing protein [Candidatus Babeliales bacterium]|nr:leucine-rich repeat domain-containing protein [Candidatus Babeliales bacterium]
MKKSVVVVGVLGCLLMVPIVFWSMEQGGPARAGKGKEREEIEEVIQAEASLWEWLVGALWEAGSALFPVVRGRSTAADDELREWALANPNDPRSIEYFIYTGAQPGPAEVAHAREEVEESKEEMIEQLAAGEAGPSGEAEPEIVRLLRAAQERLPVPERPTRGDVPSLQDQIINRIVDLISVDQEIWRQIRDKEPYLPVAFKQLIEKKYLERYEHSLPEYDYAIHDLNDLIEEGSGNEPRLVINHPWLVSLVGLTQIKGISKVRELVIQGATIYEIPSEIGDLVQLRELNLRGTRITQLPAEIGRLANLQTLNLEDTRITQLPVEIGRLANLQTLDLGNTRITQLPAEIGRLANLQTLDLGDTRITQLPAEIGRLTQLSYLNLMNTPLARNQKEIHKIRKLLPEGCWFLF